MCGRFTLRTPAGTIAELFGGVGIPEIPPRYNVAPGQSLASIRHDEGSGRFAWLKWGLVPFWARDPKIGNRLINARAETIVDKPAWRTAFQQRRCLLPADGFFEWKSTPRGKQPVYISRRDGQPFAFAGLWDRNCQTGDPLETCVIVTTVPNDLMRPIHDRMPVILPRQHHDVWLDSTFGDTVYLQELLQPAASGEWQAWPVTPQMNKPAYNVARCIEPVPVQQNLDF